MGANLMGLTPEQTTHALGIAEYHSPNAPMMRDVDHPAMVKSTRFPCGSMAGIIAAELALRGFTGIPLLFGEERYQNWIMGIGDEYLMPDGVRWKVKKDEKYGHDNRRTLF